MITYKKLTIYISEHRHAAINLLLLMSALALGGLCWRLITIAKNIILNEFRVDVNPWAFIFYHPQESALTNYIGLCVCLALYGIFIYNRKTLSYIKNHLDTLNPTFLFYSLVLSLSLLFLSLTLKSMFYIFALIIVFALPVLHFMRLPQVDAVGKVFKNLPWLILFFIVLEPIFVVTGQVYVMNEYQELYSTTIIRESLVDNKSYLANLTQDQIDALNAFYRLIPDDMKKSAGIADETEQEEAKRKERHADKDKLYFFSNFKNYDLESLKKYLILMHNVELLPLQNIDLNVLKKFHLYNRLEYVHQNMMRGQFNHIGHISNPINEYVCGKSLKDLYLQYGIGNTFLMKWTMELLGGISIQNYYKCYVFYIIYALLFFVMLYYLFQREVIYVLGAFACFGFSFYWTGFIGFILAPGIIPSIHLLDVPIILCLLLYFRHDQHTIYLWPVLLLAFFSLLINFNFGLIITASVFMALIFYAGENKQGKHRLIWFSGIVLSSMSAILLPILLFKTKADDILSYFLLGYFSWLPDSWIVMFTIIYIVASYGFLIFLKNDKSYLKYMYIFILFYSQGLFIYYYWSGLSSHLSKVMPFFGLQLFLIIYIIREILLQNGHSAAIIIKRIAGLATVISVMILCIGAGKFYLEKYQFMNNFKTHEVYAWNFDRAKVISTIDPQPIRDAVEMLQEYSKDNKGIYVLSKYDNILPFLAARYSLMPHFEMPYYLITPRERLRAIQSITENKPEYIFIDTDINNYQPGFDPSLYDPWHKIYNSDWVKQERASRYERYTELWKIYHAIANDYVKIKNGELICLYQRKEIN